MNSLFVVLTIQPPYAELKHVKCPEHNGFHPSHSEKRMPQIAVGAISTDPLEALSIARLKRESMYGDCINAIQIHAVTPNQTISLHRYMVNDDDSPMIYKTERMGANPPRSKVWSEDFYGRYGRYSLVPLEEPPRIADPGTFVAIVYIDTEAFLVREDSTSLDGIARIVKKVRRVHNHVEVFGERGMIPILSLPKVAV